MPIDFRTLIAYISEWLGAVSVAWIFTINPTVQRPPLAFRYPRREGIVSFAVFGLILISTFFYFNYFPPDFQLDFPLGPAPIVDLSQALVTALIALLVIVIALFARGQPPRSMGWDRTFLRHGVQVGMATALLILFLRNKVMNVLGGLTMPNLELLLLALGIALAEETVFRGYIQARLSFWLGIWPGIIVTALLFTVWHLPIWFNRIPTNSMLVVLGLTFVQGIVLGWIMLKSRNVTAPALYRAISIWLRLI